MVFGKGERKNGPNASAVGHFVNPKNLILRCKL